jgi:hypothetical protein
MYKYGMRLREFGIGCQPSGVVKHEYTDKNKCGYWSFIWYEKPLTDKEMFAYDLDFIQEERGA